MKEWINWMKHKRICLQMFYMKRKSYNQICTMTGLPGLNRLKVIFKTGREIKLFLEKFSHDKRNNHPFDTEWHLSHNWTAEYSRQSFHVDEHRIELHLMKCRLLGCFERTFWIEGINTSRKYHTRTAFKSKTQKINTGRKFSLRFN